MLGSHMKNEVTSPPLQRLLGVNKSVGGDARLLFVIVPLLAIRGPVLRRLGASAEPSDADRTTARQLALDGFRALERGEFGTAVERFRQADSSPPHRLRKTPALRAAPQPGCPMERGASSRRRWDPS